MFSPYLKNGIVLQVAAASEFSDYEAFQSAILKLPLSFELRGAPAVRFQSLRGRDLEFTYGSAPKVSGSVLDYSKWPLFGGPFLQADVDSERLVMTHGSMQRILDFKALRVTDSKR